MGLEDKLCGDGTGAPRQVFEDQLFMDKVSARPPPVCPPACLSVRSAHAWCRWQGAAAGGVTDEEHAALAARLAALTTSPPPEPADECVPACLPLPLPA